MKPCTGTKWVTTPTRERLATTRKRVLRSREKERSYCVGDWDESRSRSVDSECVCRVNEPRNLTSRESLPFGLWGWQHWSVVWLGAMVSPGSESRARTHWFPRNVRGPTAARSCGREPHRQEMGGRLGGRKSEHPIVPRKRGNPPQGDPVEGRGMSGGSSEGCLGRPKGTRSPGSQSPGNLRESLMDSGTSEPGTVTRPVYQLVGSVVQKRCGRKWGGMPRGRGAECQSMRKPLLRSRMRELRLSGSVGGPGQ